MSPNQRDIRNWLLRQLSETDFGLLRGSLEFVELARGQGVTEPNQPAPFVVFPETGIVSQVAITTEHQLEVGIYGREGCGPASIIAGVDRSPNRHFIQVKGDGFQVPTEALAAAMEKSRSLQALLLRYLQVFTIQTAYTAFSNGSGVIGERLARWLLMCHDRVDEDDLQLTHEFLGVMLGVRRSGVTDAIHILEGVGMIRAVRGHITILDRERLEETAGDSYGIPEAEYARLLGPVEVIEADSLARLNGVDQSRP